MKYNEIEKIIKIKIKQLNEAESYCKNTGFCETGHHSWAVSNLKEVLKEIRKIRSKELRELVKGD